MGGAVRDVGMCAGVGWGDLLDLQRNTLGLMHEITIVRGRQGAYAEDRSIYLLV